MCKTGRVPHVEVDSDGKDTHLEVESDIFLGTLTITTHSVTDTNDNKLIL